MVFLLQLSHQCTCNQSVRQLIPNWTKGALNVSLELCTKHWAQFLCLGGAFLYDFFFSNKNSDFPLVAFFLCSWLPFTCIRVASLSCGSASCFKKSLKAGCLNMETYALQLSIFPDCVSALHTQTWNLCMQLCNYTFSLCKHYFHVKVLGPYFCS